MGDEKRLLKRVVYDELLLDVLRCVTVCATVPYMGETKTRSIRVGDDVWEAIQALPGKTDDALRAVLVNRKVVADPHVEINRWFRETWKRLEDLPREILEAADARRGQKSVPVPIPNPQSSVEEFPFRPMCQHCGNEFGSRMKFATICPECKRGNHGGDRRDCPICTAAGTGAI